MSLIQSLLSQGPRLRLPWDLIGGGFLSLWAKELQNTLQGVRAAHDCLSVSQLDPCQALDRRRLCLESCWRAPCYPPLQGQAPLEGWKTGPWQWGRSLRRQVEEGTTAGGAQGPGGNDNWWVRGWGWSAFGNLCSLASGSYFPILSSFLLCSCFLFLSKLL